MNAAAAAMCCALTLTHAAMGAADEDWQRIQELEAPPGGELQSREQARAVTLQHLKKQEESLRAFIKDHAGDARSVDAALRLAHLLAVRGDLEQNATATRESKNILENVGKSAPPARAADVAFARLSLRMRGMQTNVTASSRTQLLEEMRIFQKAHPTDRRLGALLVEVATLFDDKPREKAALLEQAKPLGTEPELQGRIADDLKRIAQLGTRVEMRMPGADGRDFDLARYRGKVVVICWFADWSPPSMLALEAIRAALNGFSQQKVQPLGISLDQDRGALAENLRKLKIEWPVAFDGKGWESPLARDHGINALPTVWVLDRDGKLQTLNVRGNLGEVVQRLLRE